MYIKITNVTDESADLHNESNEGECRQYQIPSYPSYLQWGGAGESKTFACQLTNQDLERQSQAPISPTAVPELEGI